MNRVTKLEERLESAVIVRWVYEAPVSENRLEDKKRVSY